MTTDFQTKISNLYLNTRTITGTLNSVQSFLATTGTAEDIASFYTALEAEVGALSQKKAQAAGQNILSAVGIEDILNNPVAEVNASDIQGDILASQVSGPLTRATIEASQITGLIINEDIVSIAASKVAGLADVATSGEYSALLNKPNLVAIATDGTVDAEQVVGSLTNAYIAASRVDGTVAEASHAASATSLTGSLDASQISGTVAEAAHATSADSATSLTGSLDASQIAGTVAEAAHATSADSAGSLSGTIAGSKVIGAVAEAAHATSADSATSLTGSLDAAQVSGTVANANHAASADSATALTGSLDAAQVSGTVANANHAASADSATALTGSLDASQVSGSVAEAIHAASADSATSLTGSLDASQVSGSVAEAIHAASADSATSLTGSLDASQVSGSVAEATHAASADSADSLSGTIAGSKVIGAVAEATHAASADSADSLSGTIAGSKVIGAVAEATHAASADSADSLSGTIAGSQITGALGSDVTMDGSQITGLILNSEIIGLEGSRIAGNITDATIHLANVEFSDGKYYLGSYVTDNRGFQIDTTDAAVALKVVDAKIGQIDTVVIKDNTGTIVGQETSHNMFIVADMLQAIEGKIGYNIGVTYPISDYLVDMPIYASNIVGDIDASLISGSLTNANIDASNVNDLEAVATGGSLAASLVSGSLTNANIDASNVNDLEAVATGGTLAASLVSGSLTDATIDASQITGDVCSNCIDPTALTGAIYQVNIYSGTGCSGVPVGSIAANANPTTMDFLITSVLCQKFNYDSNGLILNADMSLQTGVNTCLDFTAADYLSGIIASCEYVAFHNMNT